MTMEDSRKVPLTPGEERTVEIGRILRECIRKTGRKSDMMTQYDGLTFLLLLIGVGGVGVLDDRRPDPAAVQGELPLQEGAGEFSDHPPEEAGAVIGSPAFPRMEVRS